MDDAGAVRFRERIRDLAVRSAVETPRPCAGRARSSV